MRGRPTDSGPQARKVKEGPQSIFRRWMQLSLTGRMFLLVVIAVLPALVIQAVNEYALRTAREDEIRQRVIQITKQFGEEIQAIRAGASQLLVALGELDEVQKRDAKECGATFAKLKARFESYVRIGAADDAGNVFCSSGPIIEPSVAETEFFKRSITGDGLAVGNFFIDPATGERMIHFAERFEDDEGKVGGRRVRRPRPEVAFRAPQGTRPAADRIDPDRRPARATSLRGCPIRNSSSARTCGSPMRRSWTATPRDGRRRPGSTGRPRIFGYVPPAAAAERFLSQRRPIQGRSVRRDRQRHAARHRADPCQAYWRRFMRPGSAAAISSAGRSRACSRSPPNGATEIMQPARSSTTARRKSAVSGRPSTRWPTLSRRGMRRSKRPRRSCAS